MLIQLNKHLNHATKLKGWLSYKQPYQGKRFMIFCRSWDVVRCVWSVTFFSLTPTSSRLFAKNRILTWNKVNYDHICSILKYASLLLIQIRLDDKPTFVLVSNLSKTEINGRPIHLLGRNLCVKPRRARAGLHRNRQIVITIMLILHHVIF